MFKLNNIKAIMIYRLIYLEQHYKTKFLIFNFNFFYKPLDSLFFNGTIFFMEIN